MNDATRKAAILVSCLDRRTADSLLDQMAAEQAEEIRHAVLDLEDVSPSEQQQVLDQFRQAQGLPGQDQAHAGSISSHADGVELAPSLIRRIEEGEHADSPPDAAGRQNVMGNMQPNDGPQAFAFLQNVDLNLLASFLRQEHPQTISVVVGNLPAERAAALMREFPPDVQTEVLRRVASAQQEYAADPQIMQDVEEELETLLSARWKQEEKRQQGVAVVASILEAANPQQRRDMLANLVGEDKSFASQLASAAPGTALFQEMVQGLIASQFRSDDHQTSPSSQSPPAQDARLENLPSAAKRAGPVPVDAIIDSIAKKAHGEPVDFNVLEVLSNNDLAVLIASCDPRVTLLALAGAGKRLLKRILKQLPRRDAQELRRRIDQIGPLRLRDVEGAQRRIVQLAESLAAQGRIQFLRPSKLAA